ncbi:hypothetical protein IHN32_01660 [Deinococcus sp. 14RED07]|uniref:hypothetical protein n=1 Tax=Deinococcus sp. 14RED07 TaxID=2745874 RepID=UPI001E2FC608|nr:hypothetical protein [Deinococcus sp. 14RED07]MCD0174660.1 hypothetical protein [Deinococcus sp. 14RED07]
MKLFPLLLLTTALLSACGTTQTTPPSAADVRGILTLPISTSAALSGQTLTHREGDVTFTRVGPASVQTDSKYTYLRATFTLTNTSAAPFNNMTLVAVARDTNISGTALNSMSAFGGAPSGDLAKLAPLVTPTHALNLIGGVPTLVPGATDFQVFQPAQTQSLTTQPEWLRHFRSSDRPLNYGFVASACADTCTRTVAPGGTANVNIAVRLPRGASTTYNFVMTFAIVDDSVTRVTRSVTPDETPTQAAQRLDALGVRSGGEIMTVGGMDSGPPSGRSDVATAAVLTSTTATVPQTLAFSSVPDALVAGRMTEQLSARPRGAHSGQPVTYTSGTPAVCTVTPAGLLTPIAAGDCTVTAQQHGGTRDGYTFTAAAPVSQTFTVRPPTRVELRLFNTDDISMVTVDGVRRAVYRYGSGDSGRMDVSDWFGHGDNQLRLQTINTGGQSRYGFQVWRDGVLVVNESCTSNCPSREGLIFDNTVTVTADAARKVRTTFTSAVPGDVYLNETFTGQRTPATLDLVPGTYTVGVGQEAPAAYRTQDVQVQAGRAEIAIDGAPTPAKKWRIAVLPIRTTYHGDETSDNTGILTQGEVETFYKQVASTYAQNIRPFSFGLIEWQVDYLPTWESTPLKRAADGGAGPNLAEFYKGTQLENIENEYDTVMVIYSNFTKDGARVKNNPCCAWGGGKALNIMSSFGIRGGNPDVPLDVLVHEWLHVLESYNRNKSGYNGFGGLHGGGKHGYYAENIGGNWILWYKDYMRSQVIETSEMTGELIPAIPAKVDIYAGLFDTMRAGPTGEIPKAITYPAR